MNLYQLGGPQMDAMRGGYWGAQPPMWGGQGGFPIQARGGPMYPTQMPFGSIPHPGMWGSNPPMWGHPIYGGGGGFNLGQLGQYGAPPARPIHSLGY